MKSKITSLTAALLIALILLGSLCMTAFADKENNEITILFTHDMHSHFLPITDNAGNELGGFSRLKTAIDTERLKYPDAVLADGGDFSMGSLFQTAFTTSALELRMLGHLGYDATTFGNHEFDYLQSGLADMLRSAKRSGDKLPYIVEANYLPHKAGEKGYNEDIIKAFDEYGVKDYIILERGGIYYCFFGIFGYDSDDCAPNSNMVLEAPEECAKRVISEATEYCESTYGEKPVMICLSHSGTNGDGTGEDCDLAKNVNGIDVIISGHTHTEYNAPVKINDTYIVSADEYTKNLGVLRLCRSSSKTLDLLEYRLVPIDESIEPDKDTELLIDSCKKDVEESYLSAYGFGFDEIIATNSIKFDTVDDVYDTLHESTLGSLFADAYKQIAEEAAGEKVDVALTASGVIRETIPIGKVTVSDVFNAASLGVGTEGELMSVYLTGSDLRAVLEVDATVQMLMPSAQLYCSGIEYSINTNRMLFNRCDYAMLRNSDGTKSEIEDDRLYHIVTGSYMGQMLGSVEATSKGLLSITPRDKNGDAIPADELLSHTVKDKDSKPVKEWYAIASYIKSMGSEVDSTYSQPDQRKIVYSSLNPADLLRNANIFTFAALGIIILLMLIIVLIIVLIVRKIKRRKAGITKKENKKNKAKDKG